MRILNFGSCNLDIVYTVAHIVQPGETIAASSLSFYPGGKGLNQSIALSRAGAAVFHAGCIGEDGALLYNTLSDAGVDLRYLKQLPGKSGHAVIQVDSAGENCIIIYPGTNTKITREHINSVLADFTEGDYLLLQNEISELAYLIEAGSQKKMRIVLNPSPCHEDLLKIDLNRLCYLILNEGEAETLFHTQCPRALSKILRSHYPQLTVILTLGKSGAVYITGSSCLHQPAYQVETVDTTAAGDTFTGYFISCLAQGQTPQESLRFASAAAALAVGREGAASSIPHQKEVITALEAMLPYSVNSPEEASNP